MKKCSDTKENEHGVNVVQIFNLKKGSNHFRRSEVYKHPMEAMLVSYYGKCKMYKYCLFSN